MNGTYEAFVVAGGSGAGKSTLVDGLREPAERLDLFIPKRFVTRPLRLGDSLVENEHVDDGVFDQLVADGQIDLHWERQLDGGRVVRYGFAAPGEFEDLGHRRPVYSANNAFLAEHRRNPAIRRVLESGLVIMAMCPWEVRTGRLALRSPDLSLAERLQRLEDDGVQFYGEGFDIHTVYTEGRTVADIQSELVSVVEAYSNRHV